ncbi:RibD family protein [Candidatus Gottesmanbacteria bacterium]|nr:RibD family protein [Candidatus Gottesmanbacteria bacterium]
MKTVYNHNLFAGINKNPYFFSNFVMTIDGKVQVGDKTGKLYWPIGSKLDHDTLLWLRAHADVLIHGKNTAIGFNTLQTLSRKEFKDKRKSLRKEKSLVYMVISNHPDDRLFQSLSNPPKGVLSILVTSNQFHQLQLQGLKRVGIEKIGMGKVDLHSLTHYFKKNNLQKILIEGGPTLFGSFLKENLVDEMFVTIAPKIFGSVEKSTKTMVENYLFPPNKVPKFKLVSTQVIDNELYLRYRK